MKHRSFEVILLSFVALALLATPAWFVWASAVPEPVAPDPFEQAGLDVLRPTQDDIFDGLVPLVAGTPGLYFSEGEHPEWILVAQLTTSAGYERYLDKEKKLANDIWVTPVPQVMDSCRNFGAGDVPVETRLRQYLGLGRGRKPTKVVEMWAPVAAIFRPCPDPEVHDQRCELGFPKRLEGAAQTKHVNWFLAQHEKLHQANALPFTGLGYTYDWGSKDNHVGASEYIVPEGQTVWVGSINTVDAYCDPKAPAPSRSPPKPAPATPEPTEDPAKRAPPPGPSEPASAGFGAAAVNPKPSEPAAKAN